MRLCPPCGINIVSWNIVNLFTTHALFQSHLFIIIRFSANLKSFWPRFGTHSYEIQGGTAIKTRHRCIVIWRWRGQRADLREETVFITHRWLQTSLDRTAKGNAMFKLFYTDFLRRTEAFLIKESSARFLLSYRTTLNSTTGQSPAELLLIFRLMTRLDLMRLDLKGKVFDKQSDQKYGIDKGGKERQVLVQNFCGESKWFDGPITE